jgi:hypothetical protein
MTAARPVGLPTLALLALLLAWVCLVELRPRPSVPSDPPLLGDAAAAARVELSAEGTRLVALRAPAGWADAAGRPMAVADLLEALATLRPLMVVDPSPATPDDYGLGAGAAHLEVARDDGRRLLALDLGERNPAHTGIYIRRADRPEVVLVGALLAWEVEKLRALTSGGKTPESERGAQSADRGRTR